MRYLLLCLLLVGCATTQEQAKQMSQEQLCYTAGDARDQQTYDAAINELKARGQECDKWIEHITSRQQHEDGKYGLPYTYLRCNGPDDTFFYCSAPSSSGYTLVTPVGPYPNQGYIITR